MPISQSQVLEHLGLGAGLFHERRMDAVVDRALPQDLPKRTVSRGPAVNAMGLNGLGLVNQPRYLVPSLFQNQPTERLVGPGMTATHLTDDALGPALDALSRVGVTPLYRLMAAEAVTRVGVLAP